MLTFLKPERLCASPESAHAQAGNLKTISTSSVVVTTDVANAHVAAPD